MTSATLFREGLDLDELLAELDEQHPGQVRVLEVTHSRQGGVFGFFARPKVGVQFALEDAAAHSAGAAVAAPDAGVPAEQDADPLDALIAAAEMVETGRSVPPPADGEGEVGNAEFARMLLDIASRKAAERGVLPDPGAVCAQEAQEPQNAHESLQLRRRLAELGVPFDRIPADAPHRYAAVERLVNQLPEPGALPTAGDAIVVVAGPAASVGRTARLLTDRMDLPSDRIWTFRCPSVGSGDRRLIERGDAVALAAAVRRPGAVADRPTLVAVATDDLDSDDPEWPTAASIVGALAPDAFWLHVDATRKAADTARVIGELGRPSALVVSGAARTASPASVWELNLPVAVLDGRVASRSAWAVLLLENLDEHSTERLAERAAASLTA